MLARIPFTCRRWLPLTAFVLLSSLCLNGVSWGQTAPKPAPAPPPAPAAQAPAPPRPRAPVAPSTMVFVHVRNAEGRPIAGVHVVVSGAAKKDDTTDFEGVVRLPSMADGVYHLAFDREGFLPVEQDLNLKRAQPDVVDVTLRAAPPPVEPEPPPPPPPPPPPAAAPSAASGSSTSASSPSGSAGAASGDVEQKIMSIPDFINHNFIGKEVLKESTLGCTRTATTRLLQVRNTIASHAHADVDEVLYVVAGEGAIVMAERGAQVVGPGSLGILPRGVPHTIERRGKNPLILLSMLAGAPCAADTAPKP